MAQPVFNLIKYIGGKHILANETVKTTDAPATANVIIFKSTESKVSIDGTDAFTVKYGEMNFFSSAVLSSYIFSTECDIAFGVVTEVT